jgi:TalC/MipB family fructose-6-phosphate aldolase
LALYIDCAYIPEIREVVDTLPVSGITTNPTILLAARDRGQRLSSSQLLRELLRTFAGSIFMQPGETDAAKMLQQATSFIETDKERVIAKIPMTKAGIQVGRRLKQDKYRVAFTAVTSVAQAYSAAMCEVDFIIPYFNRLDRSGIDATQRIAEMAELFHNQKVPTRILAASIKSPQDAVAALAAGAHDITAIPQVLLDMVTDPLTEEAIEKFTQDWQKMKKL